MDKYPMKKIELSEEFTSKKIVLYSLPAIISILVTTSFGLVDGYFVSNLLGIDQFAAVNLVFPIIAIFPAMGYMIGDGGSAVISAAMGRNDKDAACEVFSMCVTFVLAIGAVLGVIGFLTLPLLVNLLGAGEELHTYCVEYSRIMAIFLPAFMINMAFETLWITAEKSWGAFVTSVINGVVNAFLDWLFIGRFGMGVMGAGLATSIGHLTAALLTILYFIFPNKSSLRFRRFRMDTLKEIPGICFNGASEMLSMVAGSLSILVVNARTLVFFGEAGVDAMGIFDYIFGFFSAFFFGISSTTVTVIGYKYGRREVDEIRAFLKRGIILMLWGGVVMLILCEFLAEPLSGIFVGYDVTVHALAVHSIRIQALTFVLFGFNTFISSVFTGLEDGLGSLIIAASQSLVAPVIFVYLLPVFIGKEGIWYTIVAESIITAVLSVWLLLSRFKQTCTAYHKDL